MVGGGWATLFSPCLGMNKQDMFDKKWAMKTYENINETHP